MRDQTLAGADLMSDKGYQLSTLEKQREFAEKREASGWRKRQISDQVDRNEKLCYNEIFEELTMKYDTTDPEFKTWVKGLLHDSIIQNLRITFTKADGSDREMRCTLIESAIPADKVPKGTGREAPDATQRVFDLDKGEWRSFKWEAVKNVSFDIGATTPTHVPSMTESVRSYKEV